MVKYSPTYRRKDKNFREYVNQIIEKLLEESKKEGTIILVEGKKDVRTLKTFGIQNIISLDMLHTSLEELPFKLTKFKTIILLMDHDKRGKKLQKEIKQILQRNKLIVNDKFWKLLRSFNHIEGIKVPLM